MRLRLLKIIVFLLVSCTPLSLLVFGAVEPYGQSPHPQFPTLTDLQRGKSGALDALGEALLHRSRATQVAIQLRNTIGYGLGFVDVPELVSGRSGWLFYKQELATCDDEGSVARATAQIDAMMDFAEAAGVRMFVSLSPDKAVVHPEYLSPWAQHYFHCKANASSLLRRSLEANSPRVIDHTKVLLSYKSAHPDTPLYLATDTHWSPLGGALAFRQLIEAVFPESHGALIAPKLSGRRVPVRTDMGNRMLLLGSSEFAPELDSRAEKSLRAVVDAGSALRTVVLRDSFYATLSSTFRSVWPGATQLHVSKDAPRHARAVGGAERLIINSVERHLVKRVLNGSLAWGQPVAAALVARNMARAKGCRSFVNAGPSEGKAHESWRNVSVSNAGRIAPTGRDPRILLSIPAGSSATLACLLVEVEVPRPTTLELFFPTKGEKGAFEAGRSVRLPLKKGSRSIALVLPAYLKGQTLRLDPGDGPKRPVVLRSLELGEIEREEVSEVQDAPLALPSPEPRAG